MATNEIEKDVLARGTDEEVRQAIQLAQRYGVEYLDPDDFHMDGELFSTIPAKLMYRYNFIPLRKEDGQLVVVGSDPGDVILLNELEMALEMPVSVVVGTEAFINDILKKAKAVPESLKRQLKAFSPR